jgi:hypothetical protein
MHLGRYTSHVLLASLFAISGCAGNGQGLDQNGQPITAGETAGSGVVTPDLASIEANVFTPICSKCHIGAGAPEGLQLDAAHAYDALVGVQSAEEPNFQRVNPGNPDSSYMVLKIEGAPGIEGGQMPLGEKPLPQPTIDAIRQWITNGAPNVPAAAAAAKTFAIQTTFPSDQSTVVTPVRQIILAFTNDVDASLVNDTTVMLDQIEQPDGNAGTSVPVDRELVPANPSVLLLTPRTALSAGTYRVTIRGTGGGALADVNARVMRSDTSIVFAVESNQ